MEDREGYIDIEVDNEDINLRDYFAVQAMQSLLMNNNWIRWRYAGGAPNHILATIAADSYTIAGFMMEQRKKYD